MRSPGSRFGWWPTTSLRRGVAVGLVLIASAFAVAATAQDAPEDAPPRIYRWIDENGIAHYTTERDRIPAALRNRVGGLGRDTPARPSLGGSSDAWVARDRALDADPEGWYEEGDTPYVDPEFQAEQVEEQAIARFDLDLRIAELEMVIQEDEDALKTIVSDPNSGGPLASRENTEFRIIAMRLPKQLQELGALRNERVALEAPDESEE